MAVASLAVVGIVGLAFLSSRPAPSSGGGLQAELNTVATADSDPLAPSAGDGDRSSGVAVFAEAVEPLTASTARSTTVETPPPTRDPGTTAAPDPTPAPTDPPVTDPPPTEPPTSETTVPDPDPSVTEPTLTIPDPTDPDPTKPSITGTLPTVPFPTFPLPTVTYTIVPPTDTFPPISRPIPPDPGERVIPGR